MPNHVTDFILLSAPPSHQGAGASGCSRAGVGGQALLRARRNSRRAVAARVRTAAPNPGTAVRMAAVRAMPRWCGTKNAELSCRPACCAMVSPYASPAGRRRRNDRPQPDAGAGRATAGRSTGSRTACWRKARWPTATTPACCSTWACPSATASRCCARARAAATHAGAGAHRARRRSTTASPAWTSAPTTTCVKPYEFRELLARMRAVIRRRDGAAHSVIGSDGAAAGPDHARSAGARASARSCPRASSRCCTRCWSGPAPSCRASSWKTASTAGAKRSAATRSTS